MYRAVTCNNKDCSILYRRLKAKKDLENNNDQISQLCMQFNEMDLDW
eukprot:CAMPEP_0116903454 /NCGR_PEP_ID=MMETSP0467-20121206/10748_1 /TAXON_ID=283647 /ORGANISM="Mesodinium pulex, Strain SPMC105" /LENGTH=46 /DNA_ID= /DNA_START= /DNA_END= /DNA_ORIENTATION=